MSYNSKSYKSSLYDLCIQMSVLNFQCKAFVFYQYKKKTISIVLKSYNVTTTNPGLLVVLQMCTSLAQSQSRPSCSEIAENL